MSIFSSTSPKRHPSINDETTSTVIVPKFVAPDFKRRQLIFDSFQKLQQNTCYTQQHVTAQQYAQQATPAPVKAAFSVESTQAPASTTPTVADVRTAKGTRVHTWGAGYHGQLGVSSSRKKCRLAPSPIEFVSEPVLLVACGGFHSAILTDTGALYTWGDGRVGQLGNLARKHNMHSTPHLVDWFPTQKLIVTHVACGEYHTVAIAGGKMYSFGQGRYGQLGHGHRLDERFPRKIETDKKLGNFVMVKCGDRHTVALNDANQVITFGSGQHGQLGLGNGSDQLRPVMVEALMDKKIVHVDAGATLTAAIDDEGILYIWGFGESLYPKDESNIAHLPRRVPVREKVKQVSCGQGHLLMLTHGGDVYSMGMASMGQLGHGSNSNVRTPRLVLKGKEIQQVACGRYHSMCVTAYGIVYSFGCGESGQCGHNGLENEKLPRVIEAILPNVVGQIACGEHHSICLSSIEHSSISQDVLNWATIEAEELKIKKNMLEQFPNGLKTKQLLAMEEKRKQLILQLADSLRHEREKDMSYAQQQLRSIQSREAIVADVRTLISEGSDHGMDDMMENKPSDGNFAIAIEGVDVDAHGTALPPTDNTVTTTTSTDAASPTQPSVTSVAAAAALQRAMNSYEDSAINTQAIVDAAIAAGTQAAGTQETIPQSQSPNGSPHESRPQSRDVISPTQENLLLVPDPMSPFSSSHPLHHRLRPRPELSPSHTPSMHSRALLAHGKSSTGRRWPTSHPSHDDSDSDSEEEQEKKKKKKKGVLGPIVSQAGVKPHTPPSVAASSSPSHAPTTRTSASPGSTMRTMKRSQSQVMTIVPSSSSRPIQALPNVSMLRSSSTSALLSPTDSTTSQSSQDLAYQPIAPRISFIEKSTQQLNKVLSTIITTDVLKAEPSGYDTLIKLQKEYNRLKDERQLKSKRVMNMTRALQLLQPTKEDHEIHVKNAAAVKELKMKLVTLNTRLMESDENKRNYELYIIRMKEEDLQLSKQIDHIRRLVTEYDRLVAKLEKMNARVQGQKQEIDEESQAFHRDVAEFMIFCDDTMSRYRRILNDQYRHSVAIEKQLSLRIARQEEHRMSTIHKLESEWNATQEQTTQIKSKLESWEDKLQYYEKRYRKLTSTTGLTKAEHIIAKFYFNDEITADLKKESEERKELVARLEAERTALTAELEHWRSSYVGIAWKDVMKAESHEHEVASRTRKDEADVDRLMTKLAIVLQGMVTLSKQVKINVEQKDEEEEEEEQQRLATAAATATSKVEEEKEIISNPPTRPMSRLATSRLSPPPQEEVKEATSSPFHVELDALIANINKPKSPVVTSLGLPTGPISTRGSPSARLSQRRRDREWRECHLDNVPLWVSTLEEQLTNLMSMVEKNRIRQAERKRADELKAQAAQEAQPKTLNELIALARKVKQQTTEYDEAMAQKQTTTGTTVTAI